MSLFTKYLSIIQEAYYGKKQKDQLTVSGKDVFNQEREINQLYVPGQYIPKDESNLSEKEIQKRIAEKEMEKEKREVYVDPEAEYKKQQQLEITPQTLFGKLQKKKYLFQQSEMEQIYEDPELSYMYASSNRFKEDEINIREKLESIISTDYEWALKYAINVLKSKWTGKFKKQAEENISIDPKSYAIYIKLKEPKK